MLCFVLCRIGDVETDDSVVDRSVVDLVSVLADLPSALRFVLPSLDFSPFLNATVSTILIAYRWLSTTLRQSLTFPCEPLPSVSTTT